MKLKTIIIEDEILSRMYLLKQCSTLDFVDVVGVHESGEDALLDIENQEIDLIILNVEMVGLSGFEILDSISVLPEVVVVTANKEYAYDAYQYNVSEFLVKPLTQDQFTSAIQRVRERCQTRKILAKSRASREMYVRIDRSLVRIAYDEILYLENKGNYVKLQLVDKAYTTLQTMKTLDKSLGNYGFMRVHRTFIVNLNKVDEIHNNVIHIGKSEIPLSKSLKANFLKSLHIV